MGSPTTTLPSATSKGNATKYVIPGMALCSTSARIGIEPSSHIGVRYGLHQFADFRFQKLICHDQRLHCSASITAASRALCSATSGYVKHVRLSHIDSNTLRAMLRCYFADNA